MIDQTLSTHGTDRSRAFHIEREPSARSQHPVELRERRGRVEPVERLRDGDAVERPVANGIASAVAAVTGTSGSDAASTPHAGDRFDRDHLRAGRRAPASG